MFLFGLKINLNVNFDCFVIFSSMYFIEKRYICHYFSSNARKIYFIRQTDIYPYER